MKMGISLLLATLTLTQAAFAAVTREDYLDVLNKVQTTYKDEVKKQGYKLVISDYWEDVTVNGYAQSLGDRVIITILGGLARANYMSKDSLALVTCGEVGRVLGGRPVIDSPIESNSSARYSLRAQADYFATTKCLKNIFANEDHLAAIQGKFIPEIVTKKCASVFTNTNEKNLCIRTAVAIEEVLSLLTSLSNSSSPVSFSTPSEFITSKTLDDGDFRESFQCRLDNYFAGALCSPKNAANDGYCHGKTVGARPLCWYRPSADE
ncbi:MAG: hypothetical protein AB7I27_02885 [Bacteriovoracaceae bacterium]